jgi:hypothetical protein
MGEEKTQLLTEQMVYDQVAGLLNQKEMNTVQKDAQLFVLEHILNLLKEGQLLTINEKQEIRLWEGERRLQ